MTLRVVFAMPTIFKAAPHNADLVVGFW